VQDHAAADVAWRVQDLEALADLLARASAVARTETIAAELADLNTIHADLLAGVGETVADLDFAERIADDAATVIEQAREAIRRANEAALTLDLPDEAAGGAGAPLQAKAAAYLLSDEASFINGTVLAVDGGRSALGLDPEQAH
jgi:NAD(P)-dependent dehydrogenase (short-subunit alcohol dehydrogenase family)